MEFLSVSPNIMLAIIVSSIIWVGSLALISHWLLSYEYYYSEIQEEYYPDLARGRPYDRISRTKLVTICILAPIFALLIGFSIANEY